MRAGWRGARVFDMVGVLGFPLGRTGGGHGIEPDVRMHPPDAPKWRTPMEVP